MSGAEEIDVEVVHAETDRAVLKTYRLSLPATVADAVHKAAADADFSSIDFAAATLGIYGRTVTLQNPLVAGDRVEIYRPLAADPKAARRARVERARRQGRGGP